MKNDKSRGLDGFKVNFFNLVLTDIRVFVLRSLNYGCRTRNLAVTQKQGIITWLPKPNKNRHNLKKKLAIYFFTTSKCSVVCDS